MIINDRGRQLITSNEGLRLDPYRCPAGVWTIGYGHTGPDVERWHLAGKSITKHQAEEILEYDIQRAEEIVDNAVLVPLNGNQFSALVSFVFNVGHGKRGEKSGFVVLKDGGPSTLLRKLNDGAPLSAAEEFPKWNKGTVDGQLVVLPGLVKRRAAERALFLELPA